GPQKRTDARDTVVISSDRGAQTLVNRSLDHGPKLVDLNEPPVPADAGLDEQSRPPGLDDDCRGNGEHKRPEATEQESGHQPVHNMLDRQLHRPIHARSPLDSKRRRYWRSTLSHMRSSVNSFSTRRRPASPKARRLPSSLSNSSARCANCSGSSGGTR